MNDAHIPFCMLTASCLLLIEKDRLWNSWMFLFLLRILIGTYPIFSRALNHIKISMIHQTKPTSMGIDHAKGFKIRQPIPKLRGWLLLTVTFGHPVYWVGDEWAMGDLGLSQICGVLNLYWVGDEWVMGDLGLSQNLRSTESILSLSWSHSTKTLPKLTSTESTLCLS